MIGVGWWSGWRRIWGGRDETCSEIVPEGGQIVGAKFKNCAPFQLLLGQIVSEAMRCVRWHAAPNKDRSSCADICLMRNGENELAAIH